MCVSLVNPFPPPRLPPRVVSTIAKANLFAATTNQSVWYMVNRFDIRCRDFCCYFVRRMIKKERKTGKGKGIKRQATRGCFVCCWKTVGISCCIVGSSYRHLLRIKDILNEHFGVTEWFVSIWKRNFSWKDHLMTFKGCFLHTNNHN